jgi:hypothetical protein
MLIFTGTPRITEEHFEIQKTHKTKLSKKKNKFSVKKNNFLSFIIYQWEFFFFSMKV